MPWSKKSASSGPVTAWTRYQELLLQDATAWTQGERYLVALCHLRQEVHSDGFSGYFFYDYGDSAPTALEALPGVLGQTWADLLQEAMGLFGDPYPTDSRVRQPLILDEDNGLDNRLSAMDVRWYALEESADADAALDAFARA